MRAGQRKHIWRSLGRRLTAAVTLCAYLAAASGIPLPVLAAPKDTSQPYPCMNHPCGCRSAEQCWRNCCCLTPEQRWAWAAAHNVQPPDYAEKPAPPAPARSWRTTPKRQVAECKAEESSGCPNCCSQTEQEQSPTPKKTCCSTKPTPRPDEQPQQDQPGESKGPAPFGFSALGCQGHGTVWVSTGAVLPESARITWSPGLVPVGWLSPHDGTAVVLACAPPTPPPR